LTKHVSVFGTQESKDLELKINGRLITRVQNCKYLGTYINSSLSWKDHIEYVHKKLVKFTSISYKLRSKLNHDILKTLYFAFVYPHLLYSIEIYGNTYHSYLSKLEVLNNKILRILQNAATRTRTIDLYKDYNTLPLHLLHNYQLLLLVDKFVHHVDQLPSVFKEYFIQNKLIYDYDTRENYNMHIIAPYTLYGKRLVKYKASQLWNSLPENLKLLQSTSTFKSDLKNYLLMSI